MSETQLDTTYGKGRDGQYGKTRFCMEPNRVVTIETHKHSGSRGLLKTTATVSLDEGNGIVRFRISFGVRGDFYRTYVTANVSRVTANVVRAQHESVLAQIDRIKADIEAHYIEQAALEEQDRLAA